MQKRAGCQTESEKELDFRKKSRHDRMLCSKSFETQEVREIDERKQKSEEAFSSYRW